METALDFKLIKPDKLLADFVESFWLLHNPSDSSREFIVLPDGRVEMTFAQSATAPFHITLSGIETHAAQATLAPRTLMFGISFKLLATEYILHNTISGFVNSAVHLPAGFWDFQAADLQDFDLFRQKASQQIHSRLPRQPDERKQKLFDLIYSSKGELTVAALSERVQWSSRQINRYFNQQFGLSLKSYCTILRFRASLEHVAQGNPFPELNFTDQSHFLKEMKKFSGVSLKELRRNQNDRFIQFSMLSLK